MVTDSANLGYYRQPRAVMAQGRCTFPAVAKGIQMRTMISVLTATRVVCAAMCIAVASASYSAPRADFTIDEASLRQVMSIYGLDEAGAVARLDAEAVASELDHRIRERQLQGYAGSWFDASTASLHVATSLSADTAAIEDLGAIPVEVSRSLAELEGLRDRITVSVAQHGDGDGIISSYVDYQANRVVFEVAPFALESVAAAVGTQSDAVRVIPTETWPQLTSGPVRGAVGTRNHTWITHYAHPGVCSVGVAVNQGFLTAGHCTYGNNPTYGLEEIRTPASVYLGTAQNSTFSPSGPVDPINPRDAAWVQTGAGWVPTAQIDGYSSGTLSVPAAWAGMLPAAVGTTVCRYGQTSGGPHCGTVNGTNITACFGGLGCDTIKGLTRLAGSCSNDGDSGGPHRASSNGQVQGMTVGASTTNTCPTPTTNVYLQPIPNALNLMGRIMLTAHGAVAPTIPGIISCEGLGWGTFSCYISGYNSQGPVSLSWSTNQGASGSGSTEFNGGCHASTVPAPRVTLTISNSYGSTVYQRNFICYNGTPP